MEAEVDVEMTDTPRLSYEPRHAMRAFHARVQRYAMLVTHRRFGKTVACINDLVMRAAQHPWPTGTSFAYIAPTARQAKMVAWQYFKEYAAPFLSGTPNETSLYADFRSGARAYILGAENSDYLRGIGMAGVVLDEFATFPPDVWQEIVRPMLSDKQGWAVFIGTPRGRNEFHDIYQVACANPDRWFRLMLTADESGIIPQHELDDLQRTMSSEQYAQEYLCDFTAPLQNAYFGREISAAESQGRIGDIRTEPGELIHTAWDIGVCGSTAIWAFQVVAQGSVRLLGYYEASGKVASHYVDVCRDKGWLGVAHVPHDGRVKEWTGDGRTRVEMLFSLGLRALLVPMATKMDSINAARKVLPLCYFDAEGCRERLSFWSSDFPC